MLGRTTKPVRVVVETRLGQGVRREEIERRLVRMMTALKLRNSELSVLLTGDDQIQELNRLYRKKNRPTDVLAFAMNEGGGLPRTSPAELPRLLGDVIVSLPTARLQAKRAGRPALDEVTMLLAHGLLHLLGWDHETAAKDRAMRAETDRLCAAAEKPHRRVKRG
ncbi:MAG TPA: rRNA maturation RNase YbeY [Polyangiaceae bacterium]|jgi:probable rRNA maturation factor